MSRHRGKRQQRHLARKAARRRAKVVLREIERAQLPASARTKAKAEARETTLDQIALDKLNGLEEGTICRATYRKLCAQERPIARERRRKGRQARPAATYRHARRDMIKRRAEQRARVSWTMPPQVPPYNRSREMARRVRQQFKPAPQLRRAA